MKKVTVGIITVLVLALLVSAAPAVLADDTEPAFRPCKVTSQMFVLSVKNLSPDVERLGYLPQWSASTVRDLGDFQPNQWKRFCVTLPGGIWSAYLWARHAPVYIGQWEGYGWGPATQLRGGLPQCDSWMSAQVCGYR